MGDVETHDVQSGQRSNPSVRHHLAHNVRIQMQNAITTSGDADLMQVRRSICVGRMRHCNDHVGKDPSSRPLQSRNVPKVSGPAGSVQSTRLGREVQDTTRNQKPGLINNRIYLGNLQQHQESLHPLQQPQQNRPPQPYQSRTSRTQEPDFCEAQGQEVFERSQHGNREAMPRSQHIPVNTHRIKRRRNDVSDPSAPDPAFRPIQDNLAQTQGDYPSEVQNIRPNDRYPRCISQMHVNGNGTSVSNKSTGNYTNLVVRNPQSNVYRKMPCDGISQGVQDVNPNDAESEFRETDLFPQCETPPHTDHNERHRKTIQRPQTFLQQAVFPSSTPGICRESIPTYHRLEAGRLMRAQACLETFREQEYSNGHMRQEQVILTQDPAHTPRQPVTRGRRLSGFSEDHDIAMEIYEEQEVPASFNPPSQQPIGQCFVNALHKPFSWDDMLLRRLMRDHGNANYRHFVAYFPGKTEDEIHERVLYHMQAAHQRRRWTLNEERQLLNGMVLHDNNWHAISTFLNHRTPDATRRYYHNVLKPKLRGLQHANAGATEAHGTAQPNEVVREYGDRGNGARAAVNCAGTEDDDGDGVRDVSVDNQGDGSAVAYRELRRNGGQAGAFGKRKKTKKPKKPKEDDGNDISITTAERPSYFVEEVSGSDLDQIDSGKTKGVAEGGMNNCSNSEMI